MKTNKNKLKTNETTKHKILFEILAIFCNLEFGLKFTFTILVTVEIDNENVGYGCITVLWKNIWIKQCVGKWGCTG